MDVTAGVRPSGRCRGRDGDSRTARWVMKKVALVPLVVGVFVGGLAIKLGLDSIQQAKANTHSELVQVVVASSEILGTSEITPAMVKVIETPKTPLLGEKCYHKVEDVLHRVAAYSIPGGAVVQESLLAPPGTPPGLTVKIAPGFRAVSVKIDEVSGVAYQLHPGASVDVIVVMDLVKGHRKETISQIVLQGVDVAAVGRTLAGPEETDGKGKAAKSVTLLVKDSDVPRLHLAQTRGKITLAMRSPDDDTKVAGSGGARESELLAGIYGAGEEDGERGLEALSKLVGGTDAASSSFMQQLLAAAKSAGGAPDASLAPPAPTAPTTSPAAAPTPYVMMVVNGSGQMTELTFEHANSLHPKVTATNMMGSGAPAPSMGPAAGPMMLSLPALDEEEAGVPSSSARGPGIG